MRLPVLFGLLFSITSYGAPLTKISGSELSNKLKSVTNPVVMNFWTTWCEPCKEEFPLLMKERAANKGKVDFYFVSLDSRSQLTQAEEFLKSQKVEFETYFKNGTDDEFINAVLPEWAGAVPVTAFYGAGGKLRKLHQGVIDSKELKSNIKKIKFR